MQHSLFFVVLIAAYLAVMIVHDAGSAEEIRVWGGKMEDFKDSEGRIWHGGQNEKKEWAVGLKNCRAQQRLYNSRKKPKNWRRKRGTIRNFSML